MCIIKIKEVVVAAGPNSQSYESHEWRNLKSEPELNNTFRLELNRLGRTPHGRQQSTDVGRCFGARSCAPTPLPLLPGRRPSPCQTDQSTLSIPAPSIQITMPGQLAFPWAPSQVHFASLLDLPLSTCYQTLPITLRLERRRKRLPSPKSVR